MTVYEKLRNAVLPLVPVCVPGDYDGEAQEYCVFHVDTQPDAFAEGIPAAVYCPIVLDWYCPRGRNTVAKRLEICRALADAGFTWPFITDGSDSLTQRYIFEFEALEEELHG